MSATRPVVVITGANGLLGRHATEYLRASHEVHAAVHTAPAEPVPGVTYHVADFGGDWSPAAWPAQVDTIVHLAQSSHFREFPDRALDVFRVNIDATAKLLDYGRRAGAKRFVFASSGGIYGSGAAAFGEDAPVVSGGQLGYYLGSKLCGEILAGSYAAQMHIVVFRIFFMYGRGQKRSMLIPRLVDSIRAGREVTLQGADGLRINPVHVSDVVRALAAALHLQRSATYNIGGPQALSLRDICTAIGARVGQEPIFKAAPGTPSDLLGDISAMNADLWAPQVTVGEGVEDLL